MKIFWPNRSEAKGFLIENFSRKYTQKISSGTSKKNSNIVFDKDCKSTSEENKSSDLSYLSIKKGHWANRDFSEYREASWAYFFEENFLDSCIFLVRGMVDKINEIKNNKAIPTKL